MVKSYLYVKNKNRVNSLSKTNQSERGFEDALVLLYFVVKVIVDFIAWLRDLVIDGYLRVNGLESEKISNEVKQLVPEKKPLIEVFRVDRGFSVIARGIGLTAAYSGRRAMFAVYPALEDGLEVSSEGSASIHFEFKKKDGLLLVGYIAPVPGRYWLRVSRFGRAALGSPFVLTVEAAPPGYWGKFGAALWHDVPVRPPLLSGIVDFITEKMYMDEEGRLFKLNKDGSISSERYIVKRRRKEDISTRTYSLSKEKDNQNITSGTFIPSIDVKEQINHEEAMSISYNVIETDDANPEERILGLMPLRVVPEIRVTNDEVKEEPRDERNQSRVDQFLSGLESRYSARRTRKLERAAGDDAVSNEPCDGRGQIGAWGQSHADVSPTNDSNLIDYIYQSTLSPKKKKKFHPSNLAATFHLTKKPSSLTGIKLLHNIYRSEKQKDKTDNLNIYRAKALNNEGNCEKNYRTVQKFMSERELEITNFEVKNNSPKIHNSKLLPPALSDSNLYVKKGVKKGDKKFWGRKKYKDSNKISASFRTLSLPDFSRFLSLSVQGLRKAKSCTDWSFRALSSSSLSQSLKNIFEKEQIYHLNKKNPPAKVKSKKPAVALVRIAHYGSGKETKVIETGSRSVDEWKKYWEGAAYRKQKEVGRVCSLKIKGVVTKGKELYESSSDESSSENNKNHQFEKEKSPYKGIAKFDETAEKKSAFQKAKEIFEGNYSSLKSMEDPRYKRKRSISERFNISSLSKDLYAGVTPEHLGIPNRLPVVASLGSIYNPVYPHHPISPSRNQSFLWNDILFSDPNYV